MTAAIIALGLTAIAALRIRQAIRLGHFIAEQTGKHSDIR